MCNINSYEVKGDKQEKCDKKAGNKTIINTIDQTVEYKMLHPENSILKNKAEATLQSTNQ